MRQLVVFQSRPVSRLRYTQLGVWARPLTRTTPEGGAEFDKVEGEDAGAWPLHGRYIRMQSRTSEEENPAHLCLVRWVQPPVAR